MCPHNASKRAAYQQPQPGKPLILTVHQSSRAIRFTAGHTQGTRTSISPGETLENRDYREPTA